LSYAREGIYL